MDFDLIIVGGGPVGASLALAAQGLSVALVAQERRDSPRVPPPGLDARVYAVSPGNAGFLRSLRAWPPTPADRVTPVHAMRIFGDSGASEIEFDAYKAGVPELAWTVEDGVLQDAVWGKLEERESVQVFAPAECERLDLGPKHASLRLRDGRELRGRLVVGADGARSWVRQQSGIAARERDYGQAAVVANFVCGKPHRNTAFQWFQRGPVLALLPLPGAHVSMIWSVSPAEAERLAGLEPEVLCREVERASQGLLGTLTLATPPRTYPLRRLSAQRLIGPRVALIGDAAHVIHPLAGQGLNLGLQDARTLSVLLASREVVHEPGDMRLLRRYERSRAEPILSMDAMVDGLFKLFGTQASTVSRFRNAGLNLTNRLPVLKNLLMRHAMS